MRDLADIRLNRFNLDNINIACLLGNHDNFDKGGNYNSYDGAKVWSNGGNIAVYDQPGSIELTDGLRIHFLPYGFYNLEQLNFSKQDANILVFHDEFWLIQLWKFHGSKGIPREVLDREEFALVLGGHIHLRQELASTIAQLCISALRWNAFRRAIKALKDSW